MIYRNALGNLIGILDDDQSVEVMQFICKMFGHKTSVIEAPITRPVAVKEKVSGKRYKRQGPYYLNDRCFKTLKAMCDFYKMSYNTVASKLNRQGMELEDIFPKEVPVEKKRMSSFSELKDIKV